MEASKKTLIELAQGRITWRKTFEENAKVDSSITSYDSIRSFEDHVNLFMIPEMAAEVPFLFTDRLVTISEVQELMDKDLGTVSALVQYLKAKGYESYCFNLTADELVDSGFCVYRSLIPGLLEI